MGFVNNNRAAVRMNKLVALEIRAMRDFDATWANANLVVVMANLVAHSLRTPAKAIWRAITTPMAREAPALPRVACDAGTACLVTRVNTSS